nr:immunoglobulin light chain junction region [Macaca mulatta]
CLQYYTIPFTF